jgi:pimeloyl-ACP methyl ester carboxylesterase
LRLPSPEAQPERASGLGLTRFVARGGHRLSYATSGSGATAIVGLHDLLADRGQLRPLAAALPEARVRLVLPDARGHGAAPAIAGRQFPTRELESDLLTILDAEGIEQVHVIAVGWSAATALALAIDVPDRVASLVVHGPYLPELVTDHPDAAVREAATNHLTVLQEAAVAADKGLTDRALDLYLGARLGSGWQQRLAKPRLGAIRRSTGSLAPLLATAATERIDRQKLRDLRTPTTLFVADDAMPMVGWAAESLATLLPHARVVQTAAPLSAGSAHDLEWTTELAAALPVG